MEVKSRFEVIANLETQKRQYIVDRDSLDNKLIGMKKEIKLLKRNIEDKEDDLKTFENSLAGQKKTIDELILTVDEGLKRFSTMQK